MESKKVATNKKAFRDYFFSDRWECGVELKGGEVKSVREGAVSFSDSFVRVEKGEALLHNLHINPYKQASYMNLEPERPRRLLLHKNEIKKLQDAIALKRIAVIPTKIYINSRGLVKVEIALGKGKKLYDKREDIKKRDFDREISRRVRHKQK